jgi:hypothetical protein
MHLLNFLDARGISAQLVKSFADELEHHIVVFLYGFLERVNQGI